MKHKVISIWYEDEQDKENYMHTWLSLELENWEIIKHYSTDVVKPFSK